MSRNTRNLVSKKYLDDAMAEANETIVGVEQCRDIYQINKELCDDLVDRYDKIACQLYRLSESWDNFSRKTKNE